MSEGYCKRTKDWLRVQGYKNLGEVRAALMVAKQDPIVMRLCEQDKVILKAGVPYIFIVDEDCPACIAMNMAGKS
jgi:hypothetical protein